MKGITLIAAARRMPARNRTEEEKSRRDHDLAGNVVMTDYVNLWYTHFFFDLNSGTDPMIRAGQAVPDRLPGRRCGSSSLSTRRARSVSPIIRPGGNSPICSWG